VEISEKSNVHKVGGYPSSLTNPRIKLKNKKWKRKIKVQK